MRIAIYTCVIDGYDNLYDVCKYSRKNVDFFNITNAKNDTNQGWKTIKIDKYIDDSYCKASRTNRYYKLHPHLYFQDYDINVYIDGNKKLFNIDMLLKYCKEVYDSKELDMILPKHSDRDRLAQEVQHIIDMKKDKEDIILKQWEGYKAEGYDNSTVLTVNSVQIRKTNSPELIEFLESWWNEVKNKSYRDQLSFCYTAWKLEYKKYRLIDVFKERLHMIANNNHNRYFDVR